MGLRPGVELMDVDFATQLPDDLLLLTDKMSMAVSLECRVPLLGNELLDLSLGLPSALKMPGSRLKQPVVHTGPNPPGVALTERVSLRLADDAVPVGAGEGIITGVKILSSDPDRFYCQVCR